MTPKPIPLPCRRRTKRPRPPNASHAKANQSSAHHLRLACHAPSGGTDKSKSGLTACVTGPHLAEAPPVRDTGTGGHGPRLRWSCRARAVSGRAGLGWAVPARPCRAGPSRTLVLQPRWHPGFRVRRSPTSLRHRVPASAPPPSARRARSRFRVARSPRRYHRVAVAGHWRPDISRDVTACRGTEYLQGFGSESEIGSRRASAGSGRQ